MINESKYCRRIIETKFNKTRTMTKEDYENFEKFTKCWICEKPFEEGEFKVKYHCHITAKY